MPHTIQTLGGWSAPAPRLRQRRPVMAQPAHLGHSSLGHARSLLASQRTPKAEETLTAGNGTTPSLRGPCGPHGRASTGRKSSSAYHPQDTGLARRPRPSVSHKTEHGLRTVKARTTGPSGEALGVVNKLSSGRQVQIGGSQSRASLPPGTPANARGHFWLPQRVGVLLAASGQRPGTATYPPVYRPPSQQTMGLKHQ